MSIPAIRFIQVVERTKMKLLESITSRMNILPARLGNGTLVQPGVILIM
jgi:hypothetical protein